VTGTDDAGDKGHGDDDVEPLLYDLSVHAGDFDQDVGQDSAQDQFPYSLYPQVYNPPPVELVQYQVGGVVEGEEKQQRQTDQADHEHQVYYRLAAPEDGHADIEQKGEYHHHDTDLGDGRLLQELTAHSGKQVIAGYIS